MIRAKCNRHGVDLCHMKNIVENHIVRNVLVGEDSYNIIEFIYRMIGGRKESLILRLNCSATVVQKSIIMKIIMGLII